MANRNDDDFNNDDDDDTDRGREGRVVYCANEKEYHDAVESAGTRLVVVDCFAEWCPPCKQIAPVFEAMAREHHPEVLFLKVDVDVTPSIKSILGVWAMPTFFFLKEGSKVGYVVGANESALRRGIANGGETGGGICASVTSSCVVQ